MIIGSLGQFEALWFELDKLLQGYSFQATGIAAYCSCGECDFYSRPAVPATDDLMRLKHFVQRHTALGHRVRIDCQFSWRLEVYQ